MLKSLRSWYKYEFLYQVEKYQEKAIMWIVWNLIPYKLRYWSVIRAWADATQGEYSGVEVPSVLAVDVLKRMK